MAFFVAYYVYKPLNFEKMKIISIFIAVLFITACGKHEPANNLTEAQSEDYYTPTEISGSRSPTEKDIHIANSFFQNNNFKNDSPLYVDEILTFTDLPVSAMIVGYEGQSIEESSVILIVNNEEVVVDLEKYQTYQNGRTTIEFYQGAEHIVTINIDPETGEVSDYIIHAPGGDWLNCMRIALDACLSDPPCAFMCGIVWRQCLAAMAAACAYTAIVGGGIS